MLSFYGVSMFFLQIKKMNKEILLESLSSDERFVKCIYIFGIAEFNGYCSS